jgi:hypothetical protein
VASGAALEIGEERGERGEVETNGEESFGVA